MEEFSAKAKSKGKEFGFEGFCQIAAKFLTEEDEEKLKEELKEAFRIYDKQVGKIVLVGMRYCSVKYFHSTQACNSSLGLGGLHPSHKQLNLRSTVLIIKNACRYREMGTSQLLS